jgi:membrane protein DedA with SNARE-associated domain
MGLTEWIMEHCTSFIEATGYTGLSLLMALESMIAPVPSEAVMPFAGFLKFEGKMTWTGIALASTLGSIIGSLISYYMGYYGGRPFVTRFGKYLLLNVHDLDVTERFFNKFGAKAIFIARFVPVIRHLISIPAGVGRMNLMKFSVYTVVGACIWNTFLAWCGYRMKEHWELVHKYSKPLDIVMVVLLAAAFVYFIYAHLRQFRKNAAT